MPNVNDKDIETVLTAFVFYAKPTNPNAIICTCFGEGRQHTKDNAINGAVSYYFCKLRKSADSYNLQEDDGDGWQPIPHATWKGITYAKQLDSVWHIRCELKVQRQALARRIEKALPPKLAMLRQRLDTLQFFDFLTIETFEWERFEETVLAWAAKKHITLSMGQRFLMVSARNRPVATQVKAARSLAHKANHKHLLRRIGRGDFSTEISSIPLP